jgi:hypothetical protein
VQKRNQAAIDMADRALLRLRYRQFFATVAIIGTVLIEIGRWFVLKGTELKYWSELW